MIITLHCYRSTLLYVYVFVEYIKNIYKLRCFEKVENSVTLSKKRHITKNFTICNYTVYTVLSIVEIVNTTISSITFIRAGMDLNETIL